MTDKEIEKIVKKIEKSKKFNSNHLKPCPFCGENIYFSIVEDKPLKDYWVFCCNCETCGPIKMTKKEAVSAWNKRS